MRDPGLWLQVAEGQKPARRIIGHVLTPTQHAPCCRTHTHTHAHTNCYQLVLLQGLAEECHGESKTLCAGNHCSQQLLFLNVGCSPYLPAGAGLSGAATVDASLAFCKGNLLF